MKVQAIIPCAGVGARLKTDKRKPFVDVCGKPLFLYAVEAFDQAKSIDSIVLAAHVDEKQNIEEIIAASGLATPIQVVIGGETRRDSVCNGLSSTDEDTNIVVIHDAARPLVTPRLIDDTVKQCEDQHAVIVAVAASSTIKSVENGVVKETLKRSELWEVQTPQAFDREILKQAHDLPKDDEATDDAMLVEKLGRDVHILEGSYTNIKVTTMEDLIVAEAFLKQGQQSAI